MTPERWAEISRLYHAALACDERERQAFLAEACSSDDALRREVESLLAQSASTRGFLDESAAVAAARMVSVDVGASLLTGRRLGTYHIRERLGAGGMGEVYRAWDTKLRRDVAIKVLPSAFTEDPEWLSRFEREARVLASLNHPHIGAIYGLEEADGIRGLILELVEGPTLADRLTTGPLAVTEALNIAFQITEALDAAHERGIVHRDLKPANIKVKPDGTVKVLDFGLAKAIGADASGAAVSQGPTTSAATRQGVLLGTAPYMSPEQVRGQTVDQRTDVWAFGCVLFEMLSGRAVFKRDTIADTLAAIVEREPDWNCLPHTLPLTLHRLLKKCLAKDSRRRLRSIADAGLDIEEVLAPTAQESPSSDRRASVRWRKSTVRWAAAGILLLFAVTLVPVVVHLREEGIRVEPARFLIAPPRGSTYGFGHLDTRLAISPDGRRLAFVATNSSGVNVLWLRAMDGVSSQPLLGTEGAFSPFWSPDSQVVGFFSGGMLKKADVSGGTPQTVCAAPGAASGAWGPDGTILFSVVSEGEGIRRVSAADGQPDVVTKLNLSRRETLHFWPSFLPDGRRFLFLALTFVEGRTDHAVFAHDLDTGTTTLVLSAGSRAAYVPTGHLLYVREGTLMAQRLDEKALKVIDEPIAVASQVHYFRSTGAANFSASNTGTLVYQTGHEPSQLTWFNRSGRPLGTIGTPEYFGGLRLSPDGNRLAIAVNDARSGGADIWVYDLGTGLPTIRTTSDPSNDANAVWSPDGRNFVFNSDREGPPDLFLQSAYGNESAPKRVLAARGVQYARDWSADGRFVLYTEVSRTTGADLWALPLVGDRQPFPVADTRFDETAGKFSPDGRWLAFVSDESGRPEVYVEPFPSRGEQLRISDLGGGDPRWRADGTELFYRAVDDTLMAVPLNLGTKPPIGKPAPLFRLPGTVRNDYNHGIYDVSPDGQRFLVQSPTDVAFTSPFMVVLNWQAGLLARR